MGLSKKPNIKELKRRNNVDGLINALGDEDTFVRRSAANALGKIGDARAVEPLITALGDAGVRGRAALALGEIGDPVVEPLITAFGDEDKDVHVRWSAAIVLGKIDDLRAVPVLEKAINDSDERVRNAAKEALDEIKSSDVYNRHLEEVSRKEKAKNNALNSLEYAYSSLEKAKKLGIGTKWEGGKLNNAKCKFDEKDFSNATKLANDCKTILDEKIKEYKEAPKRKARQSLDFVYSKIKEAEALGIDVSSARDIHRKAVLEFDHGKYEQAIEYAEKAKKVANERKAGYDLTFKSISETEEIISKTRSEGVVVPDELLTKSKQAFDDGDYVAAIQLAEKLKSLVKSRGTRYSEASECIRSAKSVIERAEAFGCDISNAFSRLKKANSAFDTGNYEEAIEYAKQSEETTKKIQEESKPEITLNLPEETFSPNDWKRLDITVQNTGSMHAKDIKFKPSDDIKFKRIPGIPHLNTNETEVITISMMSTATGEVPIDIVLTYKDVLDRDYTMSEEVWISVADSTSGQVPPRGASSTIEIKRDYEVLSNNDLRFGIRVVNSTDYAIMDVKTILSYPKTLFSLKGSEIQTLSNIDPHGKRTATYKLTPRACIHNEKIDATIFFKDHTGSSQNVPMRPKEVHCVCPYLKEKPMREGEFAQLADASERIQEGLFFMGVGVSEIAGFVKESCAHRLYVIGEHEVDATQVVHLAGESLGEKAYYLLTAVIQPYEGITQVALRAYSDKPYGLHGFLSEMAGSIRHLVGSVQSVREIGVIEKKQVINIIDSVVQRTSFSGAGDGGSVDVNIEGSVVHRSNVGGGDAER